MIAYAINVEALGVTAALGAFFAPILLGRNQANADLLLLYLASMAAGLGLVAARRRWRLAPWSIAASYFGVGNRRGGGPRPSRGGCSCSAWSAGAAGLYVGLRERWWETRLLTFSGGWTLLAEAGRADSAALGGAGRRPGAVARRSGGMGSGGRRSSRSISGPAATGPGWSAGEALYFFVTPILLGWAVHGLDARFGSTPRRGWRPLIVAVPYLLAGYLRPRPAFAAVGAAALGVAAVQRWDGVPQVWALLALALLWALARPALGRTDGRWYGLLTLIAALQQLFDGAAGRRAVPTTRPSSGRGRSRCGAPWP